VYYNGEVNNDLLYKQIFLGSVFNYWRKKTMLTRTRVIGAQKLTVQVASPDVNPETAPPISKPKPGEPYIHVRPDGSCSPVAGDQDTESKKA